MDKNILEKFNLSYSALSVFKQSPLQFYFAYLSDEEQTNEGMPVYGKAGNAVHEAIEHYIETKEKDLKKFWDKFEVDNFKGFNNSSLKIDSYQEMFENGTKYVDSILSVFEDPVITPEKKIEAVIYGIKVKAFIDLEIRHNGAITIKDWKTNSKNDHAMHKDQRLFYSWLYWKTENIIPECVWIYLKDNSLQEDNFSIEELEEFDSKIKYMITDLKERGFDISKYEPGEWKGPFNNYYNLCLDEVNKRINSNNPVINLEIKGNFVFITGPVDPVLESGLDFATKFDLPSKKHMQRVMAEKGKGFIDLNEIGTIHLYNKNYKCFPIGLMDKVMKIINDYGQYYNKQLSINLVDHRDGNIMNQKLYDDIPQTVNPNLRDYQQAAIHEFIKKETGIIQIATGGGKTWTAAEIIKIVAGRTLWIIDRKELLQQTKEALEKQIGTKIGVISGKTVDIQPITIATVQSLNSKLYDLIKYLYSVNFVVVDEFHKSAAETYQKVFAKLPNTKYRLGLTATPQRDDGKDPILFSILGGIIYKIETEELINLGYLVKPKIKFYQFPSNLIPYKSYQEEYAESIARCPFRNSTIAGIVEEYKDKKIMILTKQVDHGAELQKILGEAGFDNAHIHGSINEDFRKEIYKKFVKSELKILILTISIGAEGLDIPDLDVIINAAANAGDVKSIQILGRVLRTFQNKDDAYYIDFLDGGKYTYKHSMARMKVLKEQGHDITVITTGK